MANVKSASLQVFSPVGLQYEIVRVDVSEAFSQVTASTCFRA